MGEETQRCLPQKAGKDQGAVLESQPSVRQHDCAARHVLVQPFAAGAAGQCVRLNHATR